MSYMRAVIESPTDEVGTAGDRPWEVYRMYRGREGQWAFFLHRISGVALALYLLLHVFDISLVMFGRDGPVNDFLLFSHQWPSLIGFVLIFALVTDHAIDVR